MYSRPKDPIDDHGRFVVTLHLITTNRPEYNPMSTRLNSFFLLILDEPSGIGFPSISSTQELPVLVSVLEVSRTVHVKKNIYIVLFYIYKEKT